jgi:hypothetical protein
MATKSTVAGLKKKTAELIELRAAYERYQRLEFEIKRDLVELDLNELQVKAGRVFISRGERVTVPPEVAIEVLGKLPAQEVIVTKRTVSNDILKAFVAAGKISPEQREKLLAGAEKTPTIALHIRPLK